MKTFEQMMEVLSLRPKKENRGKLERLLAFHRVVRSEFEELEPLGVDLTGCMLVQDIRFRVLTALQVAALDYILFALCEERKKGVKFDMCNWVVPSNRRVGVDLENIYPDTPTCGTTACVAGSVCLHLVQVDKLDELFGSIPKRKRYYESTMFMLLGAYTRQEHNLFEYLFSGAWGMFDNTIAGARSRIRTIREYIRIHGKGAVEGLIDAEERFSINIAFALFKALPYPCSKKVREGFESFYN